jgi:hypothetical protein
MGKQFLLGYMGVDFEKDGSLSLMRLNVLAKAQSFSAKPFPFICIEEALPEPLYKELEATFPESLICSTPALDGGITYRYKSNPVLMDQRVPQIWREFFEYHTSPEYFRACIKLFEPHLATHFPKLLDAALASNVTVRNIDNSGTFVTDCQFVVHEPIDKTGTSRTPHLDNLVEIYAGLLYLRNPDDFSAGGNFTLHDVPQEVQEVNRSLGREVGSLYHNPVLEVPYRRNTFCMFLNVKNSVHSVTPRINPLHRRRSINIIGEFNNNGYMWNVREVR